MPHASISARRRRLRASPELDAIVARLAATLHAVDTTASNRAPSQVVEKDTVFRRLVDRKFYNEYPCIIVTGRGFPDIATRALVHCLRTTLDLPVYGLVDHNSWGVGILLCYVLGSAALAVESGAYAGPVRWLGLRSSQIEDLGVPDAVMSARGVIFCFEVRRRHERSRTRRRPLTPRDRSRGNGLVDHAWIAHPDRRAWREELRKMLASGQKCELEAVCVKPRGGSDFGRLSNFVKDAILNEDWL